MKNSKSIDPSKPPPTTKEETSATQIDLIGNEMMVTTSSTTNVMHQLSSDNINIERISSQISIELCNEQNDMEISENETNNKNNNSEIQIEKEKEQNIKDEVEEEEKIIYPSSYTDLFRYNNKNDIVYFLAGLFMCVVSGAAFPLQSVFLGDAIDAFYPLDRSKINIAVYEFAGLAVIVGVSSFFAYYFLGILSARIVRRLKYQAMASVLSQDIGWFDVTNSNETVSKIALQTALLEEGIGVKLVEVLRYVSQFFAGFIIGFIKGWQLALMMCATIPFMVLSMGMVKVFIAKHGAITNELYGKAGGIAEESLGAMRTVSAINCQNQFKLAYANAVKLAEKAGQKAAQFYGIGVGILIVTYISTYALGWWWGGKLMADGNSNFQTVGDVTTVFFAISIGSAALAQIGPSIAAIFQGLGSLHNLIQIIDKPSAIDVSQSKENGFKFEKGIRGDIVFNDVTFRYPSRKKQIILNGFSLDIKAGQKVALVGSSGSGKSTLVALFQRFYDIENGNITVDGIDIKNVDMACFRGKIGLVSQEANLFSGTIAENIAFGLLGTTKYEGKTLDDIDLKDIIEAAKLANAHDFIMQFVDQYGTKVGERGIQLSGGQKQRIAIARAIIRKPAILLLDESTSALDSENEKVVQNALDLVVEELGLTTIVIAHKLSTIRNSDVIAVLQKGVVIEKGNHEELLAKNGTYSSLLRIQSTEKQDNELDSKYNMKLKEEGGRKISVRSFGQGSITVNDLEEQKNELNNQETTKFITSTKQIIKRLWSSNKSYRRITLQGFLFAGLSGCIFPANSILLTEVVIALGNNQNNMSKLTEEVNKYALCFFLFSIIAGFFYGMMGYSFRHASEKAQTAIRTVFFTALLRQDIGFFDRKENSSGILVNELSVSPTLIGAIVGENLGRLIQNITTCLFGFIISFAWGSWEVTLILLVMFPALVAVQIVQSKSLRGGSSNSESQESMGESGRLASEAVNTIRIVVSYGLENTILSNYQQNLKEVSYQNIRYALICGASVGMTSFLTFAGYAIAFYFGSLFVEHGQTTFDQVLRSLMVIMFAAIGMAQASSFMIDSNQALKAARRLFSIVDREPVIDVQSDEGIKNVAIKGNITLEKVGFCYESRPDQTILRSVNIEIPSGSTFALVGESGSGKSTIVSLTERFYDAVSGSILIDNKNIEEYNVVDLRSQIGYVGQEPTLFQGTIAENIAMGLGKNCDFPSLKTRADKGLKALATLNTTSTELQTVDSEISQKNTTKEEIVGNEELVLNNKNEQKMNKTMGVLTSIIEAAKMSNAHNFIMDFPDGYHTNVGLAGTQLSGGQKQRIAIARAIIGNPPILLLDEATSALDAESERVVQTALDNLMTIRKRTTIVIAHRLNTIKNSDKIIVMKRGKIIEQGTHKELLAMKGYYTGLCQHQNLFE